MATPSMETLRYPIGNFSFPQIGDHAGQEAPAMDR